MLSSGRGQESHFWKKKQHKLGNGVWVKETMRIWQWPITNNDFFYGMVRDTGKTSLIHIVKACQFFSIILHSNILELNPQITPTSAETLSE
jgi:hypothetical protein